MHDNKNQWLSNRVIGKLMYAVFFCHIIQICMTNMSGADDPAITDYIIINYLYFWINFFHCLKCIHCDGRYVSNYYSYLSAGDKTEINNNIIPHLYLKTVAYKLYFWPFLSRSFLYNFIQMSTTTELMFINDF